MNALKTILVVEADPVIQGWLCHILRWAAFNVSAAGSLKEALRRLSTEPGFEAVICDYCLPDGTCLDLLGGLRGYGKDSVPVLLTSGSWVNSLPLERGFELLAKPFSSAQLLAALDRLLQLPSSHESKFHKNSSPAPHQQRD